MELIKRHIAPLNVVKENPFNKPWPTSTALVRDQDPELPAQASHQMTPPATPVDAKEEEMEPAGTPRAVFHNYLRSFYPFHPSGEVSPSTVTLRLEQGNIVLVHSIHTNGWADGTLLDTGARGWLPTNYCEPFNPLPMRPLLKALTDFWDIIRGGCGSSLQEFGNQDLMKGFIAGVRFLLEKSECLTRDTPLVRKHNILRRNRKALLSELSSIVKIAKQFQEIAGGTLADADVESILDQMLLKAFKIVTRGVRFLDVWNEEIGLSRAIAALEQVQSNAASKFDCQPSLTPASQTFSLGDFAACNGNVSLPQPKEPGSQHTRTNSSRASMRTKIGERQPPRPPSVHNQRNSISHRVSYSTSSAAARNADLASERLNTAYDAFLGVLGAFIGLHLQSRSTTELLVTTQQSVQSCHVLLTVVDAVWERDFRRCTLIAEARDSMRDRLAELVQAARDAFCSPSPIEDEFVFMPNQGQRLVDAATDCVRGAGNCVARARRALEEIGDFEVSDNFQASSPEPPFANTPRPTRTHSFETDQSNLRELIQIPHAIGLDYAHSPPPSPRSSDACSFQSRSDMDRSTTVSEIPSLPSTAMLATNIDTLMFSTDAGLDESRERHDFFKREIPSAASSFTYASNLRESEMSGPSCISTRGTSPDIPKVPSLKCSKSHSTLADEDDEAEANLLERTYAHELMFRDGQIIGGSLPALVEVLTGDQSIPDTVFTSTFYLTFRLFTTPLEFAQALADRFDYIGDAPRVSQPVRLRVYNVFKTWLESHWDYDCDSPALEFIHHFAMTTLAAHLPAACNRLVELTEKVSAAHGPDPTVDANCISKLPTPGSQYQSMPAAASLPSPMINKKELNLLRQRKTGEANPSILDFEPMELARQITLKKSRIFCSIRPEELLGSMQGGSQGSNVRAMATISNDLTNFVADSILSLNEAKKRALVIKHWVKIARKCLQLNNYDSLIAIVASLEMTVILRLRQTWAFVPHKVQATLDQLKNFKGIDRNRAFYRQQLQTAEPPCLPFVGMYRTDLTFLDEGNTSRRSLPTSDGQLQVINFDKYVRTAKIIGELQRFQVPYRLAEVPELQAWIDDELARVQTAGSEQSLTLYRRSLVVEPRADAAQTAARDQPRDKFDLLLAWAHPKHKASSPS